MRLSILTSLFFFFSLSAIVVVSPRAFGATDEDFVIYEAVSRPAAELQKAAAGVLNGGRVSVLGSKVVVYGTKSQRETILHLFQELDHQLKNYVVSVRQASRGSAKQSATAVQAGVNGENVQVKKKSGVLTGNGTGSIGVGGPVGSVSVSAESNERDADSGAGERVTVMDGGSARIYGGSVFPKTVSVNLRSIGKSGAHVEIHEVDANAVGEQALVTEIDMPLGEWRTIGGVTRRDSGSGREILGSSKRSSMSNLDVQMKVDAEK
jgi:hypothetical protein